MALTRIKAQQISDIDYKQAVRVITVTNITLSGGAPNTVDGVTLVADDRILVAGQNTGSQNGIYYVSTLGTGSNGTWTRTSDANENGEIQAGMIVMVTEGTTYKDTQWKLTTNDPITIGSTTLTFEQNSAYAFGNIYANGTAVLSSAVGGTVTFTAGNNIVITGNNTSKSVQFDVSTNIATTGTVSATSNVTGGNINTAGIMSSTGNAIHGNILTAGLISATGNIQGGNLRTAGIVSSTGNITAGNLLTAGLISATGSITSANGITATANVSAGNLLTAGLISATGSITSANGITATANVTGGNITTAGIVTATSSVVGQILKSTNSSGDEGGEVQFSLPVTNTTLSTGVTIDVWQNRLRFFETGGNNRGAFIDLSVAATAVGNNLLAGGGGGGSPGGANTQIQFNDSSTFGGSAAFTFNKASNLVSASGNISSGNLLTPGLVSATGNVTGNFILGNGSQLTGMVGLTAAASAPSAPDNGDFWFYTTGNILYQRINDGTTSQWVDVLRPSLPAASTAATANTLVQRDAGGNITANNFIGTASSARYADLAEIYITDNTYDPGTVLIIGGDRELTQSIATHDYRVVGCVSTEPAYLMNSGEIGQAVALTGRVPCRVIGPVQRGDLLVTSNVPGHAQKLNKDFYQPGCVFGKSLETFDGDAGVIEILVGRY